MSIEVWYLLAVAASAVAFIAVARRKPRPEVGDDTVNMLCRHCDDAPWYPCACVGDCGRRHCPQGPHPLVDPEQLEAELALLLGGETDHA